MRRTLTRRKFLQTSGGVLAGAYALGLAGCGSSNEGGQSGGIKIGLIEDSSGDFAAAASPKVRGARLAVDEINADGGILGEQINLIVEDGQSSNSRYQELTRKLIQRDQVDVLFAGFSSASREAIRPIVDQNKQLYFYTNQYEGGVCDTNVFATGAVPSQQFETLVPYMIENYGKRIYTIAADYNFGQISAEWVRKVAEENGGEMVGEEFIPLGVSQFSQTIDKIRSAKPDVLMTLLVGSAQISFYEQQANVNLNLPMGSSVNVAQGYEHLRLDPPALVGMHVTANWVEEVSTPAAEDFKKRWRNKFPDEPYINQPGQNSYFSIYLYKLAVEKAETADQEAVREALETGNISFEAPEGLVTVDPKTHHCSHSIYLAQVVEDHKIEIPKTWDSIEPDWLASIGCNLPEKPDTSQYRPGQTAS